uniref:Uncharacterized protein n=1 Tax=Rhizophora mucronata TaxID=61149 RepID=A0A2P2NST7_RHIMU
MMLMQYDTVISAALFGTKKSQDNSRNKIGDPSFRHSTMGVQWDKTSSFWDLFSLPVSNISS